MVHALNEVQRVLSPDGILIDLRPLLDQWPIEVSWMGGYREVGRAMDLSEPLADDAAANAALAKQTTLDEFDRDLDETFSFFYYWDTPKEMQSYIEENWSDVVTVDEAVWSSLRASWSTANADARVRLRMKLLITRYRKRE
jgi:hypothetical protein